MRSTYEFQWQYLQKKDAAAGGSESFVETGSRDWVLEKDSFVDPVVVATYIRMEPSVSCHRGLTLRKVSAGHSLPAKHSGDKSYDGGEELHINY